MKSRDVCSMTMSDKKWYEQLWSLPQWNIPGVVQDQQKTSFKEKGFHPVDPVTPVMVSQATFSRRGKAQLCLKLLNFMCFWFIPQKPTRFSKTVRLLSFLLFCPFAMYSAYKEVFYCSALNTIQMFLAGFAHSDLQRYLCSLSLLVSLEPWF